MNRHIYSFLLGCLLCVAYTARGQGIPEKDAALKLKAGQWQQDTKIGFTENKGQIHDQNGKVNRTVKYLLNMQGLNVQLMANSFSYDAWVAEKPQKAVKNPFDELTLPVGQEQAPGKVQFHRVDIELEGANPHPELVVANALPGVDNIMDGPTEIRDIHSYGKVTYKDIYPGIDLEFLAKKGTDKPVEYNFIVHPGADASQIKMRYKGADAIALKDGQIEMKLSLGTLKERIPASYIQQDGNSLAVQYKQLNEDIYAFNIPAYDHSKTLVIDPTPTLMWATYLGGVESAGDDAISSVRLDNQGNVIVTGSTDATTGIATLANIGPSSGAYTNTLIKAYVVKYTAAGVKSWGVMIGGNTNDVATAVAIDGSNNIYVGMYSSSTNLRTTTPGVHQTTSGGVNDIYVAKLTPAGAYVWGTYAGGTGSEGLFGMILTNDGNLVLGGTINTASTSIAFGGGQDLTFGGALDGFILKLNATTGDGMWGTYMGGAAIEWV